ncbi:MAG: GHKL domain-containing protein [Bacteroidetes bacterium]|nr:GHKL domain-containing protein [Bacteroidota bacterium]
MTLLTDEYLQFSRLPESQPIKANLNLLIKEMLELLAEEFKQKNIKLTSKGLSKELQVRFDRAQLRRVFLNIIRNAIESMPDQGILNIWTEQNGETAIIGIQDSGHGIPEDKVNEIFNPFFTTKPTGEGTGLGLSISYDIIVEEHNGQMRFETEEGEFTEFIITLPK